MQLLQFLCGHCGKLMAVHSEHVGQPVRCPHCQHVVTAPGPSAPISSASLPDAAEVAPPPPLSTASASAAEDIFSTSDEGSDLFARREVPHIEKPPELPPSLPPEDKTVPSESQPAPEPNLPWLPQPATGSAAPSEATPPNESAALLPEGSLLSTQMSSPSRKESFATERGTRKATEVKAPWFLLLVFCPLLLYAIVISIFAFFLYRHDQQLQEQLRERFDKMPDVGDDPGVRKGRRVYLIDRYKPELATLPLPESLCTTLGKPLRIGDLQVTPNRVERKRVSVIVGHSRPEPCQHDSLVLYLDLKNLSSDYAFAPLDNYFDRYWRPGLDLVPPLTLLEIDNKYRCYGGPAHWYPRGDRINPREWVQGRGDQVDFLQPGEEKQMFVCTDGDDAKAAAILFGDRAGQEYHGPFLWRVRVRRGLVRIQGKDYSATAVIGVRFTDADIRKAPTEAQ